MDFVSHSLAFFLFPCTRLLSLSLFLSLSLKDSDLIFHYLDPQDHSEES